MFDILTIAIILMVLSITFAIVEMFFPGFGFFGITALILFAVSSIIFILEVPWGIFVVFAVAIILFVMVLFAIKQAGKNNDIFLKENLGEDEESVKIPENFVGKEGVTTTPLRPFGAAKIDDSLFQVCSEGGRYVETGEKVTVIGLSDNNIVVRPESFKMGNE